MSNQKERILIPYAGRMKFARMLKSKGCDIPDMYGTKLSREGKFDFFLFWKDSEGRDHRAWYTSFKHAPYLEIDEVVTPLTVADVIRFGLYKEKQTPTVGVLAE